MKRDSRLERLSFFYYLLFFLRNRFLHDRLKEEK